MELEIDDEQEQYTHRTLNKRPPPTFEAAFSQARSQTNHATVNYQQALINNNHSLLLLPPPPPPPSTTDNHVPENNLQSLERFILNEQLDLPLHDPASSFLTSLEQPTSSSTELIFNPSPPQPPCSPQPPSPDTLLDHHPPSSPEDLYGSSPSNPNSPQQESPPSPAEPNSVNLAPPQSSLAPSRPPPLKLCLPPRSRRPTVIQNSQTPFNSPAGSTPSTPVITTSALRPTVSGPSHAHKRTLNPSTHPTASKKQKINPLFMASSAHKSTHISETDKLKAWKQIQILRGAPRDPPESSTNGASSKAAEVRGRLEGQSSTKVPGRPASPLSNAIQLVNEAQEYVDLIQKVQDALGEELVRVQLEESVLRHVRGIIADRLVKNQDWNHQHYHHS